MTSKDALAMFTDNGDRIEFVNDQMGAIWRREGRSQAFGPEDTVAGLNNPFLIELVKSVWRSAKPYFAAAVAIDSAYNSKLTTSYFDLFFEPVKDAEGNVKAIIHTATDVSDRVRIAGHMQEKVSGETSNGNSVETGKPGQSVEEVSGKSIYSIEEPDRTTSVSPEINTFGTFVHALLPEYNALNADAKAAMYLLADAPVAIALIESSDHRILGANSEALKLWGKDVSIYGKKLEVVLPEVIEQHFIRNIIKAYNEQKVVVSNGERISLPRDGKAATFYFNIVYKPIYDSSGAVGAVMIVASDVTEQTAASGIIAASRDSLELALKTGQLGSYELDLLTMKMACSPQCKANFGLPSDARFDFDDLMASIVPSYREIVRKNVELAILNHSLYTTEYQIRLPDNSLRWIHASGKASYDMDGRPLIMTGITRDITLQKEYEQRQDDFLTVASHELKTPITVLKGNFQLLERMKDKISPALAVSLIESSGRSMNKFSAMIDELLDVSRHREGKLQLNKTIFNVADLIKECSDHIPIEDGQELIVNCPRILVNADENRIDQVLINLINNAVKYSPKGAPIKISARKQGDMVRIFVQDQGVGIAEDQIPKLFDRFWQAQGKSTYYRGLGMGLYISAEIVRRHGGEIGVASEIGSGSTFWFTLPIGLDN